MKGFIKLHDHYDGDNILIRVDSIVKVQGHCVTTLDGMCCVQEGEYEIVQLMEKAKEDKSC